MGKARIARRRVNSFVRERYNGGHNRSHAQNDIVPDYAGIPTCERRGDQQPDTEQQIHDRPPGDAPVTAIHRKFDDCDDRNDDSGDRQTPFRRVRSVECVGRNDREYSDCQVNPRRAIWDGIQDVCVLLSYIKTLPVPSRSLAQRARIFTELMTSVSARC